MGRRTLAIVVVILLIVVAAGVGGDYYWSQGREEKNVIEASGNIEATEINVGAEIAGKVAELKVDEGDKVEEGQELGQLDDTLLRAQYDQAKASLDLAKTRPDPLSLAQAQAVFNLAELNLKKATLTAPISGTVISRPIEVGEIVAAGTTIFVIANLDRVSLVVYIPEADLGKVKLGKEAKIVVDSFPDRTFSGTVKHISSEAEFTPANIQTKEQRVNLVFAATISIDNKDHDLKPGMPADAKIFK